MSIKADYSNWLSFERNEPFKVENSLNKGNIEKDLFGNELKVININTESSHLFVKTIIEAFEENYKASMSITAKILIRGVWPSIFPLSEGDMLEIKRIIFKVNYMAVVSFNRAWEKSNLPNHIVKNLSADDIELRIKENQITVGQEG